MPLCLGFVGVFEDRSTFEAADLSRACPRFRQDIVDQSPVGTENLHIGKWYVGNGFLPHRGIRRMVPFTWIVSRDLLAIHGMFP